MQIRQQILQILLAEFLIEAWHLVSPKTDDVADAVIIRGQAAQREVFVLEHSLQSRAFSAMGRIWLMAAIALGIVDAASGCLLGIESEFGIRLAPLDVAAQQKHGSQ
jgi:hypothetical protein